MAPSFTSHGCWLYCHVINSWSKLAKGIVAPFIWAAEGCRQQDELICLVSHRTMKLIFLDPSSWQQGTSLQSSIHVKQPFAIQTAKEWEKQDQMNHEFFTSDFVFADSTGGKITCERKGLLTDKPDNIYALSQCRFPCNLWTIWVQQYRYTRCNFMTVQPHLFLDLRHV